MKPTDVFSYSFSAIKLRKLRAALTTLGVIIGIAAIVALLSISQGMQNTIAGQLKQGLATDTLIVTTNSGGLGGGGGFGDGGGFGGGGGIGSGGAAGSGFKLFINYTDQINTLSPNITTSFAVIQQPGYLQIGDIIRQRTITGVNFSEYASVYSTTFVAASGSIPLSPSDNDIVVGARVSDPRLNGTTLVNMDDEGSVIWTNATRLPFVNETYTAHVSAVLQKIGGFGFVGPSDTGVYIPLSQAQSFFGTDEATFIIVQLKNSDNATIAEVSKVITDFFENQVTVISPTAVIGLLSNIVNILGLFVAGIAAISLLVAGIGIMNIMIVSLMERTREIGILKALGMKSRTVLFIFLTESVIIGLIGAVVGIILGGVLANIVAVIVVGMFTGAGGGAGGGGALVLTPVFTPEVLLSALAFGIGVSVIFALYPAWRASKLKPVEALRYE
jgi:putative ABC transport system permease protein